MVERDNRELQIIHKFKIQRVSHVLCFSICDGCKKILPLEIRFLACECKHLSL